MGQEGTWTEEVGVEWVLAKGYLTDLIKYAGDVLLHYTNLPRCDVQKNKATGLGVVLGARPCIGGGSV